MLLSTSQGWASVSKIIGLPMSGTAPSLSFLRPVMVCNIVSCAAKVSLPSIPTKKPQWLLPVIFNSLEVLAQDGVRHFHSWALVQLFPNLGYDPICASGIVTVFTTKGQLHPTSTLVLQTQSHSHPLLLPNPMFSHLSLLIGFKQGRRNKHSNTAFLLSTI